MVPHTNIWPFWLGAALPVVIFVMLLVLLLRKQLRERQQRIWMAGFIVVLCVIGTGVALLAQVSMDAAALATSAFILAVSILGLWGRHCKRHHVGALLLDLELGPSWTGWWSSAWWWYGLAMLFAGLGFVDVLSRHRSLLSVWAWSMAIYSLLMDQGRRCFEVRERGLSFSSPGYLSWKRITSSTLGDTTLTVRHHPPLGPSSWPSQVELRSSPEQRQALRHLLSQHVPETSTDTFER